MVGEGDEAEAVRVAAEGEFERELGGEELATQEGCLRLAASLQHKDHI